MEAHAKFSCVLKLGVPVPCKPEINIDQLIQSLNSIRGGLNFLFILLKLISTGGCCIRDIIASYPLAAPINLCL
jgi:hypothetical protein